MKKLIPLLLVVLLSLMATVSFAFAQDDDDGGSAEIITSACLVTDQGGIDDGNFNALANEGLQRAADEYGLETTVIESSTASDYAPNIQTCIDSGADVVVTVGFLMTDTTLESAIANPGVNFIAIDQVFDDPPENLVGTQFREDQAGFLAGVMAALMTESNIVSGVYGIDVPAVVKFRHGFEQGVRYVNPDVTILGQYTDSFNDPALGANIAEQFLGEGADVIFGAGGGTGTGGIQFAAAEGALVIGVDQDEYYTNFDAGASPGAENLITSATKEVDVPVYTQIAALAGDPEYDWRGGTVYTLGATNDGVGFAPPHDADVPEEVTTRVEEVFQMLKEGELSTGVDPVSGELLDPIGMEGEATEEPMAEETEEAAPDVTTIVDVASNTEQVSTLVTILTEVAPDTVETLNTPANATDVASKYTVFAPTNEAFEALLSELDVTLEEALEQPEMLQNILNYHVVPGAVNAEAAIFMDGREMATLQGADISVSVEDGTVVLNGEANVIQADITAQNGVIHLIDSVLMPPEDTEEGEGEDEGEGNGE